MKQDPVLREQLYAASVEVAELVFRGLKEHPLGDQTTLDGWLRVRRQTDHGNAAAAEALNARVDLLVGVAGEDAEVFSVLRRESAFRLRNGMPLSWTLSRWVADVLEGRITPPKGSGGRPTAPLYGAVLRMAVGHIDEAVNGASQDDPLLPLTRNAATEGHHTICDAVAEAARRRRLEGANSYDSVRAAWRRGDHKRLPEPIPSDLRETVADPLADLRRPPACPCRPALSAADDFWWEFAVAHGRALEKALERLRELARGRL